MDRLQNSFADGNRHRHRYHVRSPLVQSPLARWPRRLRIRSAFRAPAANKRAIFIATFAKLLLARAISLLRRSWQTGLGENDARARARVFGTSESSPSPQSAQERERSRWPKTPIFCLLFCFLLPGASRAPWNSVPRRARPGVAARCSRRFAS